MNRLKVMLLSLALFAVLGGALAFKAKFQTHYCSAPTQQNFACAALTCPNFTVSTTRLATGDFFCTTPAPNDECTYLDGSVIKSITCTTTSTKLKID